MEAKEVRDPNQNGHMLPDTPLPCAPHISTGSTQHLRWKPESHPRTLLPPFSYPIYSSSLKASPSLICNQLSTCPAFSLRQILYLIIDWLVQLLSWVWLFVTLWPATCQASLTSTIFQFAEIHVHGVSDANHLTLCPFFCLQSFPPSGSFPMIQMTKVFGASALASVFPMSIRVYLF